MNFFGNFNFNSSSDEEKNNKKSVGLPDVMKKVKGIMIASIIIIPILLILMIPALFTTGSIGNVMDMGKTVNDPNYFYDASRDPYKLEFVKHMRTVWGMNSPLNNHERKFFDKFERLIDDYETKLNGEKIPWYWILATVYANYYPGPTTPSNGDDYVYGDEGIIPDEVPEGKDPFSYDCMDLPELPELSNDETVANIKFDKNDTCEYNKKGDISKLYWKDFSIHYGGMPDPKTNPESGTSKEDYSFMNEMDFVEREDLLRGLFNQMVSKTYQCQFLDFYYDGNGNEVEVGYQNGAGVNFDGKLISFPKNDNIFQVGYYKEACKYFMDTKQPPLLKGATHRKIASDTSSYFLDLDKYKNYLQNSDFFKKKFPKDLQTKEQLNKEIYDLILNIIDEFEYEDPFSPSIDRPGSPGNGGIAPNSPKVPEFKLPIGNINITSCFQQERCYQHAGVKRCDGHLATDFGGGKGTPLYSISSGTIIKASDKVVDYKDGTTSPQCTNAVLNNVNILEVRLDPINIDGTVYNFIARYIHVQQGSISRLGLSVGSKVSAGQIVTAVGHNGCSTGPHLHFELKDANTNVKYNPQTILGLTCPY